MPAEPSPYPKGPSLTGIRGLCPNTQHCDLYAPTGYPTLPCCSLPQIPPPIPRCPHSRVPGTLPLSWPLVLRELRPENRTSQPARGTDGLRAGLGWAPRGDGQKGIFSAVCFGRERGREGLLGEGER